MPTTPRHGAHDARRRKDEGASVWACTPTRTSGPASAPALQSALPKRPQRGGARRALLYLVRTVLALAVVGGMAFGTYVLYLESHYTRIADNTLLEINQANATDVQPQLVAGQTYTATTYNIGFGAYTPDYTFFMDRGAVADGTATQGTSSVATGEQSVRDCTAGDIATMRAAAGGMAPDFMLFQEVDVDSDRSYHVDQRTALADAFPTYQSVFASNFHAGFLAWPPTSPHGRVSSGLLTLADVDVTSALRRSYPVDESFPTKFFDLDRCFEVLRVGRPRAGAHKQPHVCLRRGRHRACASALHARRRALGRARGRQLRDRRWRLESRALRVARALPLPAAGSRLGCHA